MATSRHLVDPAGRGRKRDLAAAHTLPLERSSELKTRYGLLGLAERAVWAAVAAILLIAQAAGADSTNELAGHDEYVYMISFSRDGQLMATAAGDNTAIIWNAAKREPLHVLEHDNAVYAASISPDGKYVATASGDGVVAIWNARNGAKVTQAKHHQDAVYCVAFSPDGQLLASAGGSTDGGDAVCRICRATDLKVINEFAGHKRQVYGVTFSPDGKLLATSSSDKTIRLWKVASGQSTILRGHTSDVYRCDFSPDGKQLASTSQDGSVCVWSVKTGDVSLALEGSKKSPTYTAAFSGDGRWLAAVGDDRRLRVWRTNDLHLVSEEKVASKALYAVAFFPDQRRVAVAGENGTIYIIAIDSGR